MSHDKNLKILIVDDSGTMRLMFKQMLKKSGYENIVLAVDGKDAVKKLEENQFEIVISDWHMPNMDGLDLYKALSKNRKWSEIPFLLITAEKERDKGIEAGIKEYLVKPVKPENLSNKIKEVVFGEAA